jgi:hypothetical protein
METKIVLATGVDIGYLKKINTYLDSIQKNSNFDENYLIINGLENVKIKQDKIQVVNINPSIIKSLTQNKCLQHGEFLRSQYLLDHLKDNDVIFFTDGDMWLQKPLSHLEKTKYKSFKDFDIYIGYNANPNQKLSEEYHSLQPTGYISNSISNQNWSNIKCYNTGVIAMNKKTWLFLMDEYCKLFNEVDKMFSHYAKQQWLICYIIGTYKFNIIEMDYDVHNHDHFGPVPGTSVLENNIITYNNNIVLFKHKWNGHRIE